MATHSSTLAWKIPWMEEPGRLQSMGLLRVRHYRATSLSLFTFMHWRRKWQPTPATSLSLFMFMHWRRKWQPTPVFLPGESQGRARLVGFHLWGHTESDTTEVTQQQHLYVSLVDFVFVPQNINFMKTRFLSYFKNPSPDLTNKTL